MTINPDILRDVPNMSLQEAKQVGHDYMTQWRGAKVMSVRLKRDIDAAPTSDEVCRILYNLELGSERLTTVGSKWKEHYSKNA